MPYKLQILTPEGYRRGCISCVIHHSREEHVIRQVESELPKILARGQKDVPNLYSFAVPKAFVEDTKDMLSETAAALEAKDIGGAYMRWREFSDFWEDEGISVADWWGDIIIEQPGSEKFFFYPTPKKHPRK